MSKVDKNAKFKEHVSKSYAQQAQAFLNAYWDDVQQEAERIWSFAHQFIELDIDKGKEGCDLDEFNAHRFLEKLNETKTVKQMRDELKEIDMDFNKRMALLEYLLWRYKKTLSDFVMRPQGGIDPRELAEAQRLVEEVQQALVSSQAAAEEARSKEEVSKKAQNQARLREEESKAAANEARDRENDAKAAENDAKKKEADALEKEKPFKIAQEELEAALKAMHQEEENYSRTCSELKAKSEDPNLGVVQKNKAKNELAQLQAQDPLPLRQAKINTEAAERKADKARAPFKQAREIAEAARAEASRSANQAEKARVEAERAANAAEQARKKADQAAKEAENARVAADEAVEQMYQKLTEAEDFLKEVMRRNAIAHGQIWWLERELAEAKKYMPKRRQI